MSSIDHCYLVSAGVRTGYDNREYPLGADLPPGAYSRGHRVHLSNGIDDLFVFETAEDAQHFWDEGFKEAVRYHVDGDVLVSALEGMTLWIDGKEVAKRDAALFFDERPIPPYGDEKFPEVEDVKPEQ